MESHISHSCFGVSPHFIFQVLGIVVHGSLMHIILKSGLLHEYTRGNLTAYIPAGSKIEDHGNLMIKNFRKWSGSEPAKAAAPQEAVSDSVTRSCSQKSGRLRATGSQGSMAIEVHRSFIPPFNNIYAGKCTCVYDRTKTMSRNAWKIYGHSS